MVVYSPYSVRVRVLERLSELCREVEEKGEEWARHARLCSAPDCVKYREWRRFEYNKELLDRLGIKYEYYACRVFPPEVREMYEKLPEVEPIEVIEEECRRRRKETYDPNFANYVVAYLFGFV